MDISTFELGILDYIQTLRTPVLDSVMTAITHLGDGGGIWILIAVILLISVKNRKAGISMLIALLCGLIIGNLLLKNGIARPRPSWVNPIPLLIANPTDYSFPSGHTQAAVASTVVLWHFNRKWGGASGLLAVLIAFSRMYLYVHYPTDILGGILSGILCGCLGILLGDKLWRYFTSRREEGDN